MNNSVVTTDVPRYKFLDLLFVLFIVLYSGLGINSFRSREGFITLTIITFFFSILRRIKFNKKFLWVIFIWLLYCALVGIIFSDFSPLFISRYIVFFAITYILVNYYKSAFFNYYINIIYWLSIISIAFWLWQIIADEALYNFMNTYGIDTYLDRIYYRSDIIYKSIIVFTYSNYGLSYADAVSLLPRNYAFCWEPGPAGVFIGLALLFNLFKTNFNNFLTNKNIIFFLTLLTTQSTTGILALIAFYLYYLYKTSNLKNLRVITLLMCGVVSIVLFFSFSMFYEKIEKQLETAEHIENIKDNSYSKDISISVGRFGGLLLAFDDFKSSPVLGFGDSQTEASGTLQGARVYGVNGIASIISVYGLFGIVVFLLYLRKSSLYLNKLYICNVPDGYMLYLLIAYFGFSFQNLPLFFALTFISVFVGKSHFQY